MKNLSNIFWGLVLIIIGVILGLNVLGITDINIFFSGWWTLFIIVPSFIGLFSKEDKVINIIGVLVGLLLLLSCQDMLDFSVIWKLVVPSILIIIGLSFIFKNTVCKKEFNEKIKELSKSNKESKEYTSMFSGQKINYTNEEFNGCTVTSVFGGTDIELKDAIIKKDVIINVSSIFGGTDIKMPKDVNVKVSSNSIFGGVDNKIKNNKDNKVTIYVNATCLFGGVQIK